MSNTPDYDTQRAFYTGIWRLTELGSDGDLSYLAARLERVDEDVWHPSVYDVNDPMTQDQWGTADPMSELIAKGSFNDIDRGVFAAPPV
ncbi:hypothetical protein [Nonomuraea sp. NPDC049480]|uniref:hypothetical protein n=1 Tax=Nonomuraea sp. NPDC049480 TaxID=3364353 RepID=UPI003797D745